MIHIKTINKRLQAIEQHDIENVQVVLKELVSLIDLTTLNATDDVKVVQDICDKALQVEDKMLEIPNVAAVCVYPKFAEQVSKALKGSSVKTAVVATAFPSGQTFFEVKKLETEMAVKAGAEEIDMVISRGKLLAGDDEGVFQEIKAIKSACGEAHLKVILETGELENLSQVAKASEIAIEAGADFIKTSTGKIKPAATLDAFLVMTDVVKAHYQSTGKRIGIKAAGGISTPEQALSYYKVVQQNLGEQWLNNQYFRIGASSLLNNLLQAIK